MDTQEQVVRTTANDQIDLREMFRVFWAGKWLIGGITFAAAVVAVIIMLILPDIYRAEALLAPNDQAGGDNLSALATQYGGLASLAGIAGINLDGGSTDQTTFGLEILKSRKFIAEFIERHQILVPLMAAKRWDTDSGELEIDSADYDVLAEKWIRKVWPPKKTIPSMQEAHEEFMEILSISQDKQSRFIRVSVEHYSPVIAKQWVDWLVEDINSEIMQRDVAEAQQAIAYLNEQIGSTSLAELQNVFFKLIEEQTKTMMLAKVSDEYLLKTLDPAVVPELRSRPNRILYVVLATFLGLILGFVVVSVREMRRN